MFFFSFWIFWYIMNHEQYNKWGLEREENLSPYTVEWISAMRGSNLHGKLLTCCTKHSRKNTVAFNICMYQNLQWEL